MGKTACSAATTKDDPHQPHAAPAYLNMSWMEQMLAALSGGMPIVVRARNTGLKSANGSRTVCQPAAATKAGWGSMQW